MARKRNDTPSPLVRKNNLITFKEEYDKEINQALSLKQDKTDEGLETTDKTIVGAINELNVKASKAYKFKGSVASKAELPTEGQAEGDVWNINGEDQPDYGMNYAWSETENRWDELGSIIDLTNYVTKENLDEELDPIKEELDKKSPKLVAGDGIKLEDNPDSTITISATDIEDTWEGLKFTAKGASAIVCYDVYGMEDPASLQYSYNGKDWHNWIAGEELTLIKGEHVDIKNTQNTLSSYHNNCLSFNLEGKVSASGNVNSMINFADLTPGCFSCMFSGCVNLTTAPELPATTLADRCYDRMFESCDSLTTAPELPATTLAPHCYDNMFLGCIGLITAPFLPAITLADSCYTEMFFNCENLTKVPALPATTLAESCYSSMFESCVNLTTAPELPATTLAPHCYYAMFGDCQNLTVAPKLPATTLADSCYMLMFMHCINLTVAPKLPATTLADSCYADMFGECYNLTIAPKLPATTLAKSCYQSMFLECSNLTTPPDLPATALAELCYSEMFEGCTSLTIAPALPATTLTDYCYQRMFLECSNLTTPPDLPATTLAPYCYNNMFAKCSGLTSLPEDLLPVTTLASHCYRNMFMSCSGLTSLPEDLLPATILAEYCYSGMFSGCTGLTSLPEGLLPATTLDIYCYDSMFMSCSNLENPPKIFASDIPSYACRTMFAGTAINVSENSGQFGPFFLPYLIERYSCQNMFAGTRGYTQDPVVGMAYYYNENTSLKAGLSFTDGTHLTWDEAMSDEWGEKYGYDNKALTPTSLEKGAFENVPKLSQIVFPDNTNADFTIKNQIAYNCPNLTNIYFGKSTVANFNLPREQITSFFSDCPNIIRFSVPEENKSLSCPDDKTLYSMGPLTSNMAVGFTSSSDETLDLTEQPINDIACLTFDNAKIKEIKLPVLNSINDEAFYNCPNLEKVYFDGSVWAAIALKLNLRIKWIDCPKLTEIECADGQILQIEGKPFNTDKRK